MKILFCLLETRIRFATFSQHTRAVTSHTWIMLHSKQQRNRNLPYCQQRTSPAHCYARGHWSPSCKQPPPPNSSCLLSRHDYRWSRGTWSPVHVFRCGLRSRYPAPVSVERFTPSNVWCVSHANTRLTMKPHCWCDIYLYYCLQGMMLRLHDVRSTWDAAHVIEDAHPTCVSETHVDLRMMSR